ncbi:MAG TPA: hypothetical protein VIM73_16180 [Polyangiaceae bacterium]
MQTQEFYRYRDAQGRIVIVDSESRVPPSERGKMERLVYDTPPPPTPAFLPNAAGWDWPSFGAGFAAAMLLGLVVLAFRRFNGPLARVALFVVAVVLAGGLYLGILRRSVGQGDSALASPSAVIQDARRAVERMNERQRKQDEEIQNVLREAR